jgi:hypothetical protein
MFLGDVAAGVAVLFKTLDKRGFSRATGTYHSNEWTFTGRFIHNRDFMITGYSH